MKKLLSTLTILLMTILVIAQAPQAFKYQAVVRNSSGDIISDQTVSLRLTILEGYPGGTTVYSEIHQPVTNPFGLVSLELGHGTTVSGNFEFISWSFGNHFLQLELDENGGSNFQLMGVSPFLSVPYTQWADSAGNVVYTDTSAINEIQHLSLIGHELSIDNGNSVILPDEVEDADPDPMNELQFIEISFDTLFISNGNYVVLPHGFTYWTENAGNIFFDMGNVGIGTEMPSENLHVKGNINSDSTYLLNGNRVIAVKFNHNTFIGENAGLLNSTAENNTALGSIALSSITSGGYNTAIGAAALFSNTTGSANTAIGNNTLFSNITGSSNTANGYEALYSNTTGTQNTADGLQALYWNTTGIYNTANGYRALLSNTTGYANTANGHEVLLSNTTGNYNTANGMGALYSNTTGYANTANGYRALYSNTTGDANTANGYWALYSNTDGWSNTANGYWALYSNTTGSRNTANGYWALYSNITGHHNTANGSDALYSNTAGYRNTANGSEALYSNTTGIYNTANGTVALYSNTTGSENTANGYEALCLNTTGNDNTGTGSFALELNTTGSYNVACGTNALLNNSTGDANSAFGPNALTVNTIGTYNTAIGNWAGPSSNNLTNTTAIGNNAATTASNQVRIGNSFVTSIGGYANWTNISDRRFKKNIKKDIPGLDFILQLEPVSYQLDVEKINDFLGIPDSLRNDKISKQGVQEKEAEIQTGFIAQDVESIANSIGYEFSGVDAPDNDKDHYGLRYAEFVVPLVKGMQEQQELILNQQEMINELRSEIEKLKLLNNK